jgi:tryptophan 2-C-methyltransferase
MDQRLVALVNPNKVHPPVAPYALDILTTALEDAGYHVDVVDITFRREAWRQALEDYFVQHQPFLVGVTIRNTDTNSSQDQRVFLPEHLEIVQALRQLTSAPIVAGGASFGTMPVGLVSYLGVDFGVVGPGETMLTRLADRLSRGEPVADLEGLIVRDERKVVQVPQRTPYERVVNLRGTPVYNQTMALAATPFRRRSGVAMRVDNRTYYERGGLGNILVKNGCTFFCAHCCEFYAKGRKMSSRTTADVVDELAQLTGSGIFHVHTADSEFNFRLEGTKAVLREVVRRRQADPGSSLHHLRLFSYVQPTPFDEELADLMAAAGTGGVSFGTDHACDEILRGWKIATPGGRPYYTFEDARRANDWLRARGVPTSHEFLLGMPGENEGTLRRCIEAALSLDATVFGLTLGIRLFPYQPLAMSLAEACGGERTVAGLQSNTAVAPIVLRPLDKCESRAAYELQFIFDEHGRTRPVYYFSPDLPEPPEVVSSPSGRRIATLRLIHEWVPRSEHARVMLQPLASATDDFSNTQVDPPLLIALYKLGYRGSAWSWWPKLKEIEAEARAQRLL